MLKVTVGEDCDNAPKRAQLRDLTIAFAENDQANVLKELTDNICWNLVGERALEGKDAVVAALAPLQKSKAVELIITSVITHGNIGATDGTVEMDDGKSYAFCNVCRFSSHAKNAKIKEITSYIIALN